MPNWFARVLIALAALLPLHPVRAADETVCAAEGAAAERQFAIPPGLLLAIGRVESGRRDPASRQVAAWPWTINAAGAGQSFASLPPALATTRALQGQGIASIDIGCFQVNLVAHPAAFASLEEAFDPAANAQVAARFLTALRERTGSWEAAVAAYHSSTPERGGPYRDRVLAAWGQAVPAVVPAAPVVLRVLAWVPPVGGMKVWTPSGAAAASVITLYGAPGRTTPRLPRVRTLQD